MAAEDALEAEPTTNEHAEAVDRLIGIFRTGRMESARPAGYDLSQNPVIERQSLLVEADENQDQFFHKKIGALDWCSTVVLLVRTIFNFYNFSVFK